MIVGSLTSTTHSALIGSDGLTWSARVSLHGTKHLKVKELQCKFIIL